MSSGTNRYMFILLAPICYRAAHTSTFMCCPLEARVMHRELPRVADFQRDTQGREPAFFGPDALLARDGTQRGLRR